MQTFAEKWLVINQKNPDRLHLRIKDDGLGSTNSEGGFGLLGVRERVQLLNGVVFVGTSGHAGNSLNILPLLVPDLRTDSFLQNYYQPV